MTRSLMIAEENGRHSSLDQAGEFFTPGEVAQLLKLSADSVRRIFQDEPGVLVLLGSGRRRKKQQYTTIRIPRQVLERVLQAKARR